MSTPPAEQPDLLQRMSQLQDQGEKLVSSLRSREDQLRSQLDKYFPSGSVTVQVRHSDSGFPEELSIENASDQHDPSEYLQALNTAFLLAQAKNPRLPVEAAKELIDALSRGEQPPQVSVSDDFGQITVVAAYGDVRSVDAAQRWLETTPDATIASEVLRIAQQAVRESDRFRRFG